MKSSEIQHNLIYDETSLYNPEDTNGVIEGTQYLDNIVCTGLEEFCVLEGVTPDFAKRDEGTAKTVRTYSDSWAGKALALFAGDSKNRDGEPQKSQVEGDYQLIQTERTQRENAQTNAYVSNERSQYLEEYGMGSANSRNLRDDMLALTPGVQEIIGSLDKKTWQRVKDELQKGTERGAKNAQRIIEQHKGLSTAYNAPGDFGQAQQEVKKRREVRPVEDVIADDVNGQVTQFTPRQEVARSKMSSLEIINHNIAIRINDEEWRKKIEREALSRR